MFSSSQGDLMFLVFSKRLNVSCQGDPIFVILSGRCPCLPSTRCSPSSSSFPAASGFSFLRRMEQSRFAHCNGLKLDTFVHPQVFRIHWIMAALVFLKSLSLFFHGVRLKASNIVLFKFSAYLISITCPV